VTGSFRFVSLTALVPLLLGVESLRGGVLNLTIPGELQGHDNKQVRVRRVGTNPAKRDNSRIENPVQTPDSKYTLALKSIERNDTDQYYRYTFLVWKNDSDQETTEVLFFVIFRGKDFVEDVPVTVIDGAAEPPVEMQIPIRSFDPVPPCRQAKLKTSPLPVFLGGSTEIPVSLECDDSLPRKIKSIEGPSGLGIIGVMLDINRPITML
jgi:hypothetical protein